MRYGPLLLLLALTAVCASTARAQTLTERVAEIVAEEGVTGSVIVTRAGATLVAAGYGMADRELGVPNAPDTRFRIGSITKQLTAVAILILQDRGKLGVQDRVVDHLPDAPPAWQPLTLHQLLTHTSGIMHSWALEGFEATMMIPATLDETLERFHDRPLTFEPGTSYQYSGVGYFLLAKIVETVSGRPYEDFLTEEIFEPLGMEHSGADRADVLIPNRASGYTRADNGEIHNAPVIHMPILTGGGNLYSTVEDLARWDQALTRGDLLSAEAYEAMYRPERENYGYGWRIEDVDGRRTIFHSGSVSGFNGFILRIPGEQLCVVVLVNTTPGRAGPAARRIAAAVLDGRTAS